MVENIDDVTLDIEEDGELVVETLDKKLLSKGAWSTVLFKFREWDNRKDEMGPVKYTIRRYRKLKGVYRQQSKFNISSHKQARKLVDFLEEWLKEYED